MIKGNKIITLDADDLLYYTDGGRQVYERYLGKVKKVMKRPWGTDDHPSWGVFRSGDIWMWRDNATEEAGTAIQFVQRLFGLSYRDAITKIAFDFNLTDKEVISSRVYEMQEYEPTKYTHITAITQRFKKGHHLFWNSAEVDEQWCKGKGCYAVSKLAVNHVKYPISPDEVVFVYLADDIDKVKIYFPQREKQYRFKNNVPGTYLWQYNHTDKCNKLVTHKSMKDLIVFSLLHPHNIATQNESVQVFNEENREKISKICEENWVFYGSDRDGVEKCQKVTKEYGYKYINTPAAMLPEINDVYGYVKKHGLRKLEEFCKQKQLL